MTSAAFDRLAGFPLRRVAFAEVGTPLPGSADEELHPAFGPFLVPDEPPVPVFYPYRMSRIHDMPRFKTMSLVLDVGMGETLARLVLPALRLEQAADGSLVRFMFSSAMLRRWSEEERVPSSPGLTVETGGSFVAGQRVFMKGGMVYDAGTEIRNAAVTARRAGMPVGEILDEVSEALKEEGRLERHEKVVKQFRDAIVDKLGGVLRGNLVQDLAERIAVEAEELAGNGALDVGTLKLDAIRKAASGGR